MTSFADRFPPLLSTSWPPHLPSPGKLEHIIQVFFNKVPFSTELLNKPRFLSRLALPPTHKDFPHPGELEFDSFLLVLSSDLIRCLCFFSSSSACDLLLHGEGTSRFQLFAIWKGS